MKNEIPIVAKETEKDDSSFSEESNTRVLEMALVAYVQSSVSLSDSSVISSSDEEESLVNDKIQSHFSTIFKDKDVLKDEDLYY